MPGVIWTALDWIKVNLESLFLKEPTAQGLEHGKYFINQIVDPNLKKEYQEKLNRWYFRKELE